MSIYNIPEFKIEELEKKMNHILKKCEKYGNSFIYRKGDAFFDKVEIDNKSYTFLFYQLK